MATKGDSVSAANFNALFTQLDKIRDEHAARADLSSAQKTNLNNISVTNVVKGNSVTPDAVQRIQTGLDTLANNGTSISTTFASNITVPTAGTLLEASNLTAIETNLNNADGVCPNCAFHASNFGSNFSPNFDSHFDSFFSSFFSSHFGSNFSSNFNDVSSQGHFSGRFGVM